MPELDPTYKERALKIVDEMGLNRHFIIQDTYTGAAVFLAAYQAVLLKDALKILDAIERNR